MCARMRKDDIRTLKILKSMSEFGGLWKHQNKPACTKSVSVQNVKVGHYTKEEEDIKILTIIMFGQLYVRLWNSFVFCFVFTIVLAWL